MGIGRPSSPSPDVTRTAIVEDATAFADVLTAAAADPGVSFPSQFMAPLMTRRAIDTIQAPNQLVPTRTFDPKFYDTATAIVAGATQTALVTPPSQETSESVDLTITAIIDFATQTAEAAMVTTSPTIDPIYAQATEIIAEATMRAVLKTATALPPLSMGGLIVIDSTLIDASEMTPVATNVPVRVMEAMLQMTPDIWTCEYGDIDTFDDLELESEITEAFNISLDEPSVIENVFVQHLLVNCDSLWHEGWLVLLVDVSLDEKLDARRSID